MADQVNVEFDLRAAAMRSQNPHSGLAAFEEVRIRRMHAHRHAPDFNDEAETLDFGGELRQGATRFLGSLNL